MIRVDGVTKTTPIKVWRRFIDAAKGDLQRIKIMWRAYQEAQGA